MRIVDARVDDGDGDGVAAARHSPGFRRVDVRVGRSPTAADRKADVVQAPETAEEGIVRRHVGADDEVRLGVAHPEVAAELRERTRGGIGPQPRERTVDLLEAALLACPDLGENLLLLGCRHAGLEADQELARFYRDVLPADFSAARRMTYAWVPALARRASVRYEARHSEIELSREQDRGSDARLARLKTRVVLQGDYEGIRQFVYELETSPEFVIIDDVAIAQAEANKPLTLTLELSTYYRLGADGT